MDAQAKEMKNKACVRLIHSLLFIFFFDDRLFN
jgi:hypothetical protein